MSSMAMRVISLARRDCPDDLALGMGEGKTRPRRGCAVGERGQERGSEKSEALSRTVVSGAVAPAGSEHRGGVQVRESLRERLESFPTRGCVGKGLADSFLPLLFHA